jgi:hypothetical protein
VAWNGEAAKKEDQERNGEQDFPPSPIGQASKVGASQKGRKPLSRNANLCFILLPDLRALLTGGSEFSLAEGVAKSAVGFLLPDILYLLLPDVSEDHPLTVHSVALQIIIGP